ncbi:MAG TPA: hypothetical protein VER39_00180 [Nocardioidaceae bacterium]|nr:hypothetical protein [Nocardioidaceae bacterium]
MATHPARARQHSHDSPASLLSDLSIAARMRPAASYQRPGYVCASALLLSGLLHVVVYLVSGGPWEGPLSWRKPIVFGLSFGLTLATVAWILPFLRVRAATGWVTVGVLSATSLGEVSLITMQTWRGVASHFNESTPFDAAVFSTMGVLVALVGLVTVFVTARSFFPQDAPASLAWAIRAGLVLMIASLVVGVQMIVEGGNTFGDAGALKVPHAITLHAVQVLPALAVLLSLADVSERSRVRTVGVGALGYTLLIAAAMLQTYEGRAPLDPGLTSSAAALAGLALLGWSAVRSLSWFAARRRGAHEAAAHVRPVP